MDGWASSARGVAATLLDIGQTRLALAATELEEARLLLAQQALALAGALFFAALGVVCGALAWVLLAPPPERPLRLACVAAGSLAVAALCALAWHRRATRRPALLGATIDELRKDCAVLRPRAPA
ncbi:phage holin family protein [Aquabacterium humicola]|uniref:phage holin family protein n=1 Tax=Aquabacterium humicola TaxID=3237377 RepID=UPI002542AF43|nr:phage holin family protein [Rubrivivax pictus]